MNKERQKPAVKHRLPKKEVLTSRRLPKSDSTELQGEEVEITFEDESVIEIDFSESENITLKEIFDPNGIPVEQLKVEQAEIKGDIVPKDTVKSLLLGMRIRQKNISLFVYGLIVISSVTLCLATVCDKFPFWLNIGLGVAFTGLIYFVLYKGSKVLQTIASLCILVILVTAISIVIQSLGTLIFGTFYFLPSVLITLTIMLFVGVLGYLADRKK